ncbi:MAG: I78 family peptidase inhibitor [Parvibaculum sp.]|uniref:I78 family peptidase inhibitor n=1 Tax=Parvibaculum sp. TaxID=2024848 RepID=UPI0032643C46
MKHSPKYLLGTAAVAALLVVAACDQNEEEQTGDAVGEMESSETAVPLTSEPGDATADSTMPAGNMPESEMPGSEMDENDMSMGEEAAAENTDAETIAGTQGDEAAVDCQAAADALDSSWTGKPYADAEAEISQNEDVETIRVIRPDEAVTQDFRTDRLNVELDADDNITRIYCG